MCRNMSVKVKWTMLPQVISALWRWKGRPKPTKFILFTAMKWNYQISAIKMKLWEKSLPRLASVSDIVPPQQGSLVLCKTTTQWVLTWAMAKGWSTHSFRDGGAKVLSLRGPSGSSKVGDSAGICYTIVKTGVVVKTVMNTSTHGGFSGPSLQSLYPSKALIPPAGYWASPAREAAQRCKPTSKTHFSALQNALPAAMTTFLWITCLHEQTPFLPKTHTDVLKHHIDSNSLGSTKPSSV